jgi:hypothetical protein
VNKQAHLESELSSFLKQVQSVKAEWAAIDLARKRLRYYRWKLVEELDKHLLEFESSVKRTGGTVAWGYETGDSLSYIQSLLETSPRAAYLPSKIASELGLAVQLNIPSLSKFKSDHNEALPDILFVSAKFTLSATGHVYYAGSNKEDFEAIAQAKQVVFFAGIDSVLSSQSELELAKGLYACYEIGAPVYPFELLTKPGKPDNRFSQQINVLMVDHGRSHLLHSEGARLFFLLQNFELPGVIAKLFWDTESAFPLQQFMTDPMLGEGLKNKNFLFANNGFNRLSQFLPFEADIYDFFMHARLEFMANSKSNFFLKLTKANYAKLFLDSKTKLTHKRFLPFVKEKIFGQDFKIEQAADRTFIDQYYYDKRKI